MEKDFWINKWNAGEIGFHQSDIHSYLKKHFAHLKPGKVIVPLCGKSLDLIWLLNQGHEVVGVELSPIACEAFFAENKIAYIKFSTEHFWVYQSEKVTLWCGDFFKLPNSVWRSCNYIYDRAALIALPETLRIQYVNTIKKAFHMYSCLSEALLIAIDYPSKDQGGPPFSVPENWVKSHFESFLKVSLLESRQDDSLKSRNPKFETLTVTERAYRLQNF